MSMGKNLKLLRGTTKKLIVPLSTIRFSHICDKYGLNISPIPKILIQVWGVYTGIIQIGGLAPTWGRTIYIIYDITMLKLAVRN